MSAVVCPLDGDFRGGGVSLSSLGRGIVCPDRRRWSPKQFPNRCFGERRLRCRPRSPIHFSLGAKRNDFSAHGKWRRSSKQQDKQISVYAREPVAVINGEKAEAPPPTLEIQGSDENIDKTAATFNPFLHRVSLYKFHIRGDFWRMALGFFCRDYSKCVLYKLSTVCNH